MIREINNQDWSIICQRITEQRAAATVKLEVIGSDSIKIEKAANATLQSMAFVKTDGCSDGITLRLKNPHEIIHEIVEPIRIQLQSSGKSDDFNLIFIEAESGITILTLHPAVHQQMLAGLKSD